MNIEFKGTPGPWEYEVDLDYDQGGNAIGLGPVVEVNGEVILKGITRNGTVEGCNFKDVRLAAAAPKLLEALKRMLDLDCPLTGDPSRAELIEHWEYEQSQGNGAAEDNLFALAVIAEALGEQP